MCSEQLKISPFYSKLSYNSPQKAAASTKNRSATLFRIPDFVNITTYVTDNKEKWAYVMSSRESGFILNTEVTQNVCPPKWTSLSALFV